MIRGRQARPILRRPRGLLPRALLALACALPPCGAGVAGGGAGAEAGGPDGGSAATPDRAPQGPVETIEVRGSAEGPALDSTAFATVIRAADFAGRITTLDELLREAVGVQVKSLGGEFATVSIRGSTAEQVVVYLDGVPLNRALGGGVNLADLPLGQVDSIEIYRGFTPASLPSASIGGAVLIRTRAASGRRSGSLSASYGSFGTGEAIASVTGGRGRADYALGFDGSWSRGDFTFLDDNGTEFTTEDDEPARRRNNDFRRGHLTGRTRVRLGERARLGVTADVLARSQGVPGIGADQSRSARYGASRGLLRAELEAPGLLLGRLLLRGAIDGTRLTEGFDDHDDGGGFVPSTRNVIDSFGEEAGLVLAPGGGQALSFLASHRRESADLEDRTGSASNRGTAARDAWVFTLEDEVSIAGGRLLVNPSLRHEAYASLFRTGSVVGLAPPSPETSESHTTGKAGFRLRLGDGLALKGNAGRFARVPDFTELFGNRGSVLGNPALAAERGRSLDLGFSLVRRPGRILRHVAAEGTIFETLADDLIIFQPISQGVVKARNLSRARVRGAELSLSLALGPHLTGSLNATRQRAVNRSRDPNDGKLLPGRPVDELSATLGLALGRGRISYAFTYVGPNFVDPANTEDRALPARYLHDLGYVHRLPRGMKATFEVKNLADQRTADVYRFPLPGRSVAGRLLWEF